MRKIVKNPEKAIKEKQNQIILKNIKKFGKDGDWLIIRGYKFVDDSIVNITSTPFSHVGILDRAKETVIEAERPGVHEIPLYEFIDKAYRLILVRPIWSKKKEGKEAIAMAHSFIGKPYNFTGIVGLPAPNSCYCSELAVEIYKKYFKGEDNMPTVITPVALLEWGTIIYDSGVRD